VLLLLQIHIVEMKRDQTGSADADPTAGADLTTAAVDSKEFRKLADVDHPYPATKLAWSPAASASLSEDDLLATAGDYLRLWKVDSAGGNTKMKTLLNNNKHTGMEMPSDVDSIVSKYVFSQNIVHR
jgi:hypothetical protein